MAHECPTCGCTCYCNGDIDDCCFSFAEDVNKCTCCPDPDGVDDEEDDYYYDAAAEDFGSGQAQTNNISMVGEAPQIGEAPTSPC